MTGTGRTEIERLAQQRIDDRIAQAPIRRPRRSLRCLAAHRLQRFTGAVDN